MCINFLLFHIDLCFSLGNGIKVTQWCCFLFGRSKKHKLMFMKCSVHIETRFKYNVYLTIHKAKRENENESVTEFNNMQFNANDWCSPLLSTWIIDDNKLQCCCNNIAHSVKLKCIFEDRISKKTIIMQPFIGYGNQPDCERSVAPLECLISHLNALYFIVSVVFGHEMYWFEAFQATALHIISFLRLHRKIVLMSRWIKCKTRWISLTT